MMGIATPENSNEFGTSWAISFIKSKICSKGYVKTQIRPLLLVLERKRGFFLPQPYLRQIAHANNYCLRRTATRGVTGEWLLWHFGYPKKFLAVKFQLHWRSGINQKKTQPVKTGWAWNSYGRGGRIWTYDLRVMSPTSWRFHRFSPRMYPLNAQRWLGVLFFAFPTIVGFYFFCILNLIFCGHFCGHNLGQKLLLKTNRKEVEMQKPYLHQHTSWLTDRYATHHNKTHRRIPTGNLSKHSYPVSSW